MLSATKWNLLAGVMFDTVSLPTIKKMTDSSYSMPVSADAAPGSRITTHVAMEVLVVYNDFPDLPPLSAVVADSAAPVVTAARLVYTQTRDSAHTDQLTVVFSETIKQPQSIHPFLVKSVISGVQYRFRLEWISSNNEINVFRVDTIEGGALAYAKKGDSLWIDVLALISDNFGNTQLNPLNRRVPLDVVMPPAQPSQWEIKAVPNPFSPSTGSSTEIKAVSKKALLDPEQYSMSIVIFDVIGNSVTSAVLAQKNNNEWSVVWDGRNHNKRIVSSGVYICAVTAVDKTDALKLLLIQ